MSDPFDYANQQTAAQRMLTDAENAALQQRPGSIYHVADYTAHHLRMSCLDLAVRVPDGAAPPPLEEVMTRAERYWRFILSGLAKPPERRLFDE